MSDHPEQPYRHSISIIVTTENRVEELVAEISQTIRAAEPERRAELKELAEALLRDEMSSIVEMTSQIESAPRRYSSNPLLAGLLLILLGLGFLVIVPAVGITLGFITVVLAAWGGFMRWIKK